MIRYEKTWVEGIEDDLKHLNDEEFNRLDRKLDAILEDPHKKTRPVQGWDGIRRLRLGKHRLLLYINDLTIYVLAFRLRKDCYSKKVKNEMEQMVAYLKADVQK